MDLLALVGIGYLLRRWRRRAPERSPAPVPPAFPSVPAPASSLVVLERLPTMLLMRAARGLLLAGLLVLMALLPWPTAWATSAALAPIVWTWRLAIVQQLDVLLVSLVSLALVEPALLQLLRALRSIPRLCGLLAQLAWVSSRIAYWRYRNRRRVTTR